MTDYLAHQPVVDLDVLWDHAPESLLAVIVRWPTGVRYAHQYGGTACMQGEVEGYLVPVDSAAASARLRHLFVTTLGGAGTVHARSFWPEDWLAEINASLALIQMSASIADEGGRSTALTLDDDRLPEADEAWLPVLARSAGVSAQRGDRGAGEGEQAVRQLAVGSQSWVSPAITSTARSSSSLVL